MVRSSIYSLLEIDTGLAAVTCLTGGFTLSSWILLGASLVLFLVLGAVSLMEES